MRHVYAALFTTSGDGGYVVEFPDLPGSGTQGDDLYEALDMAEHALGEWLSYLSDKGVELPEATGLGEIELGAGQFVNWIRAKNVGGEGREQYRDGGLVYRT